MFSTTPPIFLSSKMHVHSSSGIHHTFEYTQRYLTVDWWPFLSSPSKLPISGHQLLVMMIVGRLRGQGVLHVMDKSSKTEPQICSSSRSIEASHRSKEVSAQLVTSFM